MKKRKLSGGSQTSTKSRTSSSPSRSSSSTMSSVVSSSSDESAAAVTPSKKVQAVRPRLVVRLDLTDGRSSAEGSRGSSSSGRPGSSPSEPPTPSSSTASTSARTYPAPTVPSSTPARAPLAGIDLNQNWDPPRRNVGGDPGGNPLPPIVLQQAGPRCLWVGSRTVNQSNR